MPALLIDGTYELFRHFFGVPSHVTAAGEEVAAARAVVGSVLRLIETGTTHVGVATDKVIESFRNDLWPGYKTGEGIDPVLLSQFPLLDGALEALGVALWAMVELEADDALATAAARLAEEGAVGEVVICTPDKDLAQCVVDGKPSPSGSPERGRVVQFDRRKEARFDEAGVVERLGVPPASVPDLLALMGDSADGFPGIRGWGKGSSVALLARYGHIEDIPPDPAAWDVPVRGAARLSAALEEQRELAALFKVLATLRTDAPIDATAAALEWKGPRPEFAEWAQRFDAPALVERAEAAAAR
jgi:5'-3' exonuclease